MYSITAKLSGPTPTSAMLVLQTRKATTSVSWPNIAPPAAALASTAPPGKASPAPLPTSSPEATMWFERKSDDVLNVSVASTGGVACESPAVALSGATTRFPVVTVYDDSHHHDSLPERSPLDHIPVITDATFVKKVDLVYPMLAQDQGISGTVVVGIDIGPDGNALYAWVHARDAILKSATVLDGPAIWAALHSTYVPQIADGRPTTSTYDIIYEYVLGEGIRQPTPPAATVDYYEQCPAILGTLRVSVSDRSDHTQWYSLSVSAEGPNPPTGVVIGMRDSEKKNTGLSWAPIPFRNYPRTTTKWYADGSFNWKGAPITLAWVDQATMSDGKVVTCQPVSDAPFNLADGTEFPRYIAGDPLPLLSMQQVQPAQFTREAWPQYPTGPNRAREAGFAVVQIAVDETGTIREAFLIQTSGVRSLDSAALFAATSSDYQPAATGAVALYEAVYQFVP